MVCGRGRGAHWGQGHGAAHPHSVGRAEGARRRGPARGNLFALAIRAQQHLRPGVDVAQVVGEGGNVVGIKAGLRRSKRVLLALHTQHRRCIRKGRGGL